MLPCVTSGKPILTYKSYHFSCVSSNMLCLLSGVQHFSSWLHLLFGVASVYLHYSRFFPLKQPGIRFCGFLFYPRSFLFENFSVILENRQQIFVVFLSIPPALTYNCNFYTVIIFIYLIKYVKFFRLVFRNTIFVFFLKTFQLFRKTARRKRKRKIGMQCEYKNRSGYSSRIRHTFLFLLHLHSTEGVQNSQHGHAHIGEDRRPHVCQAHGTENQYQCFDPQGKYDVLPDDGHGPP